MNRVTFVIPCAPYHIHLLPRALASLHAQTVPVDHVAIFDADRRGAGWARNRGIERVKTEFLVFLDADDEVLPSYAERTLARWRGKFVYTDWFQDEHIVRAPKCAWSPKTHNTITALIPTEWALEAMFDETLTGNEDADFFMRMAQRGRCGQRLAEPLFKYSADGQRSQRWVDGGTVQRDQEESGRKYGGVVTMCCGGDSVDSDSSLDGEDLVLAVATWGYNARIRGTITGTLYPRTGHGKELMVDPRDIEASAGMFVRVSPPPPLNEGFMAAARQFAATMPAPAPTPPPPALVANVSPDMAGVIRKARRTAGTAKMATFIMPDKVYPSYADLRRLIRLAQYDTVSSAEAKWNDPSETFIIVTPEPFQCPAHAKAKAIFWNFEYGGMYAPRPESYEGCELWSADQGWASAHNAKYVALGSDARLAGERVDGEKYDLTMLAYMTARRQAIKRSLSEFRWTPDYPGNFAARNAVLWNTRLMLNVHQNEGVNAVAPQRLALAAAYHLPVITEAMEDMAGSHVDDYAFASYALLADEVRQWLASDTSFSKEQRNSLYNWLCVENTFATLLEAGLKSG